MGIILEALENQGKCTAREIAALLGADPKEVINTLCALELSGRVSQLNGYWICIYSAEASATSKTATKQEIVISAAREKGPISSEEIVRLTGYRIATVSTMLRHAYTRGELVRTEEKRMYFYSAPASTQFQRLEEAQ